MWRFILLVLFIGCAKCQCPGYTIISVDVSDQCDCTKIVSDTVYRGGVSADVIVTDAVSASWNSSTGDCIGCYTDPNGDFGDALSASSDFSSEMTGCLENTAYSAYNATVSASMADSDLPTISFGGCAPSPYIAPSDVTKPVTAPAPDIELTQTTAPTAKIPSLATPEVAPAPSTTVPTASPAAASDVSTQAVPTASPAAASDTPTQAVPTASSTVASDAPTQASSTPTPAPQRGRKNRPSLIWIVLMVLVSIFGICNGQNVIVFTSTGECSPAPAPALVPSPSEDTNTGTNTDTNTNTNTDTNPDQNASDDSINCPICLGHIVPFSPAIQILGGN